MIELGDWERAAHEWPYWAEFHNERLYAEAFAYDPPPPPVPADWPRPRFRWSWPLWRILGELFIRRWRNFWVGAQWGEVKGERFVMFDWFLDWRAACDDPLRGITPELRIPALDRLAKRIGRWVRRHTTDIGWYSDCDVCLFQGYGENEDFDAIIRTWSVGTEDGTDHRAQFYRFCPRCGAKELDEEGSL